MAIRNTVDRNPDYNDPDTDGIYLKDLSTGSLTQLDAAGVTGGGGYSLRPASQTTARGSYSRQTRPTSRRDRWRGLYILTRSRVRSATFLRSWSLGGHGSSDISGNGEYVAYTANGRVYRLELETGDSLLVPTGDQDPNAYLAQSGQSISSDGRYVVMTAPRGGPEVPIIADMVTLTAAPLLPDDAHGNQGYGRVLAVADNGQVLISSSRDWNYENPNGQDMLWMSSFNLEPTGVVFSLTDDAGGRFQIDPASGEITVADADLLLYEGGTSHQVTVLATGDDGSTQTEVSRSRSPTRILIRCSGRR